MTTSQQETKDERLDRIARRLEPTAGRILVSPIAGEEETMRGGLHIPATAQEKPVQGIIRAIGPVNVDEIRSQLGKDAIYGQQLKVGQRILFSKYGGTEIVVDGEDFLILGAADVLTIIHEEAPDPA